MDLDLDFKELTAEDFRFDVDMDFDFEENRLKNRFKTVKILKPQTIKYENAQKMAKEIKLDETNMIYAIITGSFIFGDFIEALVEDKKLEVEEMYISTLGMNQNNIDSLGNLLIDYHVKKINLIVSNYFVSNEVKDLMPYLLDELSGLNINVAIAGNHSKVVLIKTKCGKHLVINGSANLSSSSNLEQFSMMDNKEIYEFNKDVFDLINENFTIWDGITYKYTYTKKINRDCRNKNLARKVMNEDGK